MPDRAALILIGDIDQLPSVGPGRGVGGHHRLSGGARCAPDEVFARRPRPDHRQCPSHQSGQHAGLGAGSYSDFHFVQCRDAEDAAAKIVEIVKDRVPARFGLDPDPRHPGAVPDEPWWPGGRALNLELQRVLNPPGENAVQRFGWTFGAIDKVMQIENDYDKDVYSGDLGFVHAVDAEAGEVLVEFDGRVVAYGFGELDELVLAYATTIQIAGARVSGRSDPADRAALHAPAQPALHGRNPRQAACGSRRSAQAVGIAVRGSQSLRRWSKLRDWPVPSRVVAICSQFDTADER